VKRAFFVLGPEGSGTRLVTKTLMAMGCAGDAGHEQQWDNQRPTDDLIVWRRSVPHHRQWVSPAQMRIHVGLEYQPHVVITMRDWDCIIKSQRRNGFTCDHSKLQMVYSMLFGWVTSTPFTIVSFESLVLHGDMAQHRLAELLGLRLRSPVVVHDANEKYMEVA
jgi:hypothetical protein